MPRQPELYSYEQRQIGPGLVNLVFNLSRVPNRSQRPPYYPLALACTTSASSPFLRPRPSGTIATTYCRYYAHLALCLSPGHAITVASSTFISQPRYRPVSASTHVANSVLAVKALLTAPYSGLWLSHSHSAVLRGCANRDHLDIHNPYSTIILSRSVANTPFLNLTLASNYTQRHGGQNWYQGAHARRRV